MGPQSAKVSETQRTAGVNPGRMEKNDSEEEGDVDFYKRGSFRELLGSLERLNAGEIRNEGTI